MRSIKEILVICKTFHYCWNDEIDNCFMCHALYDAKKLHHITYVEYETVIEFICRDVLRNEHSTVVNMLCLNDGDWKRDSKDAVREFWDNLIEGLE